MGADLGIGVGVGAGGLHFDISNVFTVSEVLSFDHWWDCDCGGDGGDGG